MTSGFSGLPKLRQSVTAVGHGARDGDVAVRLGEGELRALVGVELAEAAVAVGRDREAETGVLVDADHAGVVGERQRRVAHDEVVVLVRHPRRVGEVGARDELRELVAQRVGVDGRGSSADAESSRSASIQVG